MRAWGISLCCVVAACGPTNRGGGNPGGVDAHRDTDAAPVDPVDAAPPIDALGCTAIDVLFVIDNSGSMAEEQANLAQNFPQFVSVLDASGLDYRVGVTTTGRDYTWSMATPIGNIPESQDGGDNGNLLAPAACNMTKKWIDKGDPDPAAAFACVANVGTGGPSEEMPLAAMRDAFEARIADGANAGFHRPDALLAVVILTDEDDCSYEQSVTLPFATEICSTMQEPVGNYLTFLDGFATARGRWATAVIAGTGPGDCSSSFGSAEEANRLEDFVSQTGANGKISSICAGDLSIGLADALVVFQSACDSFPIP